MSLVLWQAQHGREAPANRAELQKRGAPVPAWMFPPEIEPGADVWYMAFWELSTDRKFPGGPIPNSSILSYETYDKEGFRECIRAMDRAYLEFMSKPQEDRKSMKVFGPGILTGGKK